MPRYLIYLADAEKMPAGRAYRPAPDLWLRRPGLYTPTASLEAGDLEHLYKLTQNVGGVSWSCNPQVKLLAGIDPARVRSLSVGDVAVSGGVVWMAGHTGWFKLG